MLDSVETGTMVELVAPSAGVPSGLAMLLIDLAVPALMALVMYVNLTRYEEDRRFAWIVATFLAGLGNAGFGSIVVGLLYYTVE